MIQRSVYGVLSNGCAVGRITGEAFPNASNTGASAGLPAYGGSYTLNTPTAIDGKTLTETVVINTGGAGSTIRGCYADLSAVSPSFGIDVNGVVADLIIEDNTFIGPGLAFASNAGISLGGATNALVRRNNVSAWENGILFGISGTVEDNYVHDLRGGSGTPHEDGISCHGGQTSGTIRHNTVISRDTSCIFLKTDFGDVANMTLDNNYLSGTVSAGPLYPINCTDSGGGNITGLVVTDNHIKILGDTTGPWSFDGFSPATLSGNVNADTLALLAGQ